MKRILFWLVLLCLTLTALVAAAESLVDDEAISSVEERRILVSIEDQYAKLDEREAAIATREMQLKTLEGEVDKKLAAMQQLRQELMTLLDRKEQVEGERLGELSLIYEKMNPQKAALLIQDLDEQMAVELLLGIKKKTAGKILENLDPVKATELSRAFTDIPVASAAGE